MSYVIIEPLNIKIRRFLAKCRGTEDPVVKDFDRMHRDLFNASHGVFKSPDTEKESGKDQKSDSK